MSFTRPGLLHSIVWPGAEKATDCREPDYTDHIRALVGDLVVETPYCRACGHQNAYCTCEE